MFETIHNVHHLLSGPALAGHHTAQLANHTQKLNLVASNTEVYNRSSDPKNFILRKCVNPQENHH